MASVVWRRPPRRCPGRRDQRSSRVPRRPLRASARRLHQPVRLAPDPLGPENAIELASVEPEDGRAPDLSVGGAALIVALPPGDHEVLGTVDPDLDQRSCLIRRVGAETPAQVVLPPLPHRDPPSLRPDPLRPPPEPDPEEPAPSSPAPGQLDMWG